MLVPVYDIKNCGPRHRFAANGKLVHNSDSINLQNLPRNSPLKRAILAPPGHLLIDSDSSQIEARTLAWLAGQEDLIEAFENGEDVYRIMAAKIYGKDPADITKDERFVGKTVILGCGYGTGWAKLQSTLKAATPSIAISEDEARTIIATYREAYPRIPTLWREADRALAAIIGDATSPIGREDVLAVEGLAGIRLPNNLYIRYPNLRWREDQETLRSEYVYDTKRGKAVIPTRIYGAKVVENLCQALARIVIGEQMLMVAKKYRVAMTVHDAIAAVVPEDEGERAKEFVELCMRMRPAWALDLPLNCEAKIGASYGG
jgi:DNA polymerase I-like protein with 3'-5' exonuclease and polymerase domains